VRARKAVVRKGRENYVCLLNFQEQVNGAQLGNGDLIGLALTARWARATRDGDMTGGDFPAWLPTLFAIAPMQQASPSNLVDRRGECVHAGCQHYRICFIEKAVRASKRADIVIANHALVLTQAAFDGARAARGLKGDNETTSVKRVVFDEGHHLFDAADSAFSAALSGAEAAELRRWIRGPEGRGRRGRGLEARLLDILGDREGARQALTAVLHAAAALPGEGWSGRVAPPDGPVHPIGPIESYLVAVIEQLRARSSERGGIEQGLQCAARPAVDLVRERSAERRGSGERPLTLNTAILHGVAEFVRGNRYCGHRGSVCHAGREFEGFVARIVVVAQVAGHFLDLNIGQSGRVEDVPLPDAIQSRLANQIDGLLPPFQGLHQNFQLTACFT